HLPAHARGAARRKQTTDRVKNCNRLPWGHKLLNSLVSFECADGAMREGPRRDTTENKQGAWPKMQRRSLVIGAERRLALLVSRRSRIPPRRRSRAALGFVACITRR